MQYSSGLTCDTKTKERRYSDLVLVMSPSKVEHGYTRDTCVECWTELSGGTSPARNTQQKQSPQRERRGQHERIKGNLKMCKEELVVPGGALDTEGLEEDVQKLFRWKENGTEAWWQCAGKMITLTYASCSQ